MSDKHSYNVLLALHHDTQLKMWCQLAKQFTPHHGEIYLRGMVTVPIDQSLSEGARAARQWRDAFQVALEDPLIHDHVHIHVEHHPIRRIMDDVRDLKDINKHNLKEYQHFFETYKVLKGKKNEVVVKGFKGCKDAIAAVKRSVKLYEKEFGTEV